MAYNYSKLRGKIREVFKTEGAFAKELGISKVSLSAKLNNTVGFTQDEIVKTAFLLNISSAGIPDIFFNQIVKNS